MLIALGFRGVVQVERFVSAWFQRLELKSDTLLSSVGFHFHLRLYTKDDRNLPDLCLGLYRDVVVFDHATKQMFAVHWVDTTLFDGDVEAGHCPLDQCRKGTLH